MKAFLIGGVLGMLLLAACSSERVPDTQRMEQDSAQQIMDTVPDMDMRTDTVAER
ncbi:MAG: hypothetical protein V4658_06460 [Bacteroidota bacterium]